ncbi:MAG: hypothetical protein AAF517_08560 [Planctomycetota bacterium]
MTLLLQLMGWAWVVLGAWWFLRPQGIRRRLERGLRGQLRTILLLALWTIGGLLFVAGRELGGIAGYALPVVGCIAALKGLLLLRSRISEPVFAWWADQSDTVYRIAAVSLLCAGLLIQWWTSDSSAPPPPPAHESSEQPSTEPPAND